MLRLQKSIYGQYNFGRNFYFGLSATGVEVERRRLLRWFEEGIYTLELKSIAAFLGLVEVVVGGDSGLPKKAEGKHDSKKVKH